MVEKLKVMLGLDSKSPYQRKFFERANVIAGIYMSVVMIVLEVWMLTSLVFNILFGGKERTFVWIVQHSASYIVLLAMATLLLVYCVRYMKGREVSGIWGRVIMSSFAFVCILFGVYISYLDYAKGEQILTFLTMILFAVTLLNWRPIVSIGILTVSFGGFYLLMDSAVEATYATQVNFFIYWISILMVSISIYHQRRSEAEKSERIEQVNERLTRLAVRDEVTGIHNMNYFRDEVPKLLKDESIPLDSVRFLFFNIRHFKTYNEKFDFSEGDNLLSRFAMRIDRTFVGEPVARMADDHFVVFTTDAEKINDKIEEIRNAIHENIGEVYLDLKVGGYQPESRDENIGSACDKARYACERIRNRYDEVYREYDKSFDEKRAKKHYINTHIEAALRKGYVKAYYQPVVWAKDGTVCSVEALARWEDPEYGFLSPGDFIPVLEDSRQIHLLDKEIINIVCADIRERMDAGEPVLPVSVNFSRLDFELMDVVEVMKEAVSSHEVPTKYIHVEVTESALMENFDELKRSMERLSEEGFPIWLDDFGSGYSSLNVLKDYAFNVIKIDMKFLSNFSENEKTKPILSSVVKMAGDIEMRTLTEGVETEDQAEFLRAIGCERLQGFLYGRPMPKEELFDKLANGELTLSEQLLM